VLKQPRHRVEVIRRQEVSEVAARAALAMLCTGIVTLGAVPALAHAQAQPLPGFERALLAQREGFGAKTSGGAGGRVRHVTSSANSGRGSLRTALRGSGPVWIRFDRNMKIHLRSGLVVGDNVTIDGRGHRVTLTGHGTDGLLLVHDRNVIIENLVLHNFGNTARTAENDTPDAVHVDDAHRVWIDHCDLSMAGDKLISIDDGASKITVSWNRFHDQEQTFQIGDQATGRATRKTWVTIDHNYFDATGYRNPLVMYGKAHLYNNYVRNWGLFGARVQTVGQMYVENNVFRARHDVRATMVTANGNGCNDAHTRCDARSGYLRASGNLLRNGARLQINRPGKVFVPSHYYRYHADPATPALARRIREKAGLRAP
jgi:pectate lyase